MEVKEKLDVFFRAAICAADRQSEEIRSEQERLYLESVEAYEKKKEEEFGTRVRIAKSRMEKEENRAVSEQLLQWKKAYHDRQEEKKDELFAMVKKRLEEYRKSTEYESFLVKKLEEAKKYAKEDSLTIFLDPEDMWRQKELADKTGCVITICEDTFGGGIRGVVKQRNLFLDETFDRKLREERERFSF
ncbi:MAG: V-type ATP synthase subunit E [Clostridiales bacterium]|nr:V-type ATP synthase subunit E [Clostridiales bacterium]